MVWVDVLDVSFMNKLLVLASPKTSQVSPISHSELLIALHQISPDECDLKMIMSGRVSLLPRNHPDELFRSDDTLLQRTCDLHARCSRCGHSAAGRRQSHSRSVHANGSASAEFLPEDGRFRDEHLAEIDHQTGRTGDEDRSRR